MSSAKPLVWIIDETDRLAKFNDGTYLRRLQAWAKRMVDTHKLVVYFIAADGN